MNYRKFVFVAIFVVCLAAGCALANDGNVEEKENKEEPRNGAQKRIVELPAMIDFTRFKQLYHKHYPTAIVAMNRAKLFATNAYHVFISRVNYVWRKSSSFLAINKYSDMTALERHNLLDIHIGEDPHEAEEEEDEEPQAGQRRKKRDIESEELDLQLRQLTAEDLMREVPELPEHIARSIADGSIGIDDVLHSSDQLAAGNDSSSSGENHRRTKRVPDQVYMDLRTSGCIGPVKHQGEYCNSCYAMGVSVQYEYRFCRQTGTHATFSDQYVVDCGRQFKQTHTSRNIRDLNGCSSGHGSAVGYFYSSYGFELEHDYPYRGVENECPVPINRPEHQLGRVRVRNGLLQEVRRSRINDPTIMRLMSISGPVSVVTQVDDDFHFYGGGVQSFSCSRFSFGHVLVLVGRGIEDNREYWIMRNTFGSDWGENGYWRVSTSIANCFNQVLALKDPQFVYNQQYVGL